MIQCVKDKFSYDDIGINKANKIICDRYSDSDQYDNIKDKTTLFAKKTDKYKKKDSKTLAI